MIASTTQRRRKARIQTAPAVVTIGVNNNNKGGSGRDKVHETAAAEKNNNKSGGGRDKVHNAAAVQKIIKRWRQ